MKRIVCLLLLSGIGLMAMAQPKKTPPKVQPKKDSVVLQNLLDSFSYAVGMSVVLQYKEFGVKTLNVKAVMQAVNDVCKNDPCRFSNDQANYILNSYINQLMAIEAAENVKIGNAFLEKNKTKPGINVLPSGIQYQVVRQGNGALPKTTDTVTVHYTGTLIDGTVFDNSLDRGEPAVFTVGGVIAGWTEILQKMPVGSRWKVFIPASLAYNNFSPPGSNIPPGSTLIFDMELLSIGTPPAR